MRLLSSTYTLPSAFLIHTAVPGAYHPDTTPRPWEGETAFLETLVSWFRTLESWEDEASAKASATRPHLPPMRAVYEGLPTGIGYDVAKWLSKLARRYFESTSVAPSFSFEPAGCKPVPSSRPSEPLHVGQWIFGSIIYPVVVKSVSRSRLLARDLLNIKDDEDPTKSRLLVLVPPRHVCHAWEVHTSSSHGSSTEQQQRNIRRVLLFFGWFVCTGQSNMQFRDFIDWCRVIWTKESELWSMTERNVPAFLSSLPPVCLGRRINAALLLFLFFSRNGKSAPAWAQSTRSM